MVGDSGPAVCLVCLAILLTGCAGTPEGLGPAPGEGLDPETEAVRKELMEAGVKVPPDGDRQEVAVTADPAPAAVRPKRSKPKTQAAVRLEPTENPGWDPRLKAEVHAGPVFLRLRGRPQGAMDRPVYGYAAATTRRWGLWTGDLSYRWGRGILTSAPMRGSTLSAAGGFGAGPAGPTGSAPDGDPRAVQGAAVVMAVGPLRLDVLSGRIAAAGDRTIQERQVAALRFGGEKTGMGFLVSRAGSETGGSWLGSFRRGAVSGGWEAAAWRPGPDPAWSAAGTFHLSCRGGSSFLCEGIAAAADGGAAPTAGRRPGVLPLWVGHGWAGRFRWNPSRSLRLNGLVARGQGKDRGAAARLVDTGLLDAEVTWRPAGRWSFFARLRRKTERESRWSRERPWAPACPGPETKADVSTLAATWNGGGRQGRILWRRLSTVTTTRVRRRSLGTFSLRDGDGIWRWRISWATAWGGDGDLVGAFVPYAGLVMPRHWGYWRSESGGGLRYVSGVWDLRIGGSCRLPEPDTGRRIETTMWVEIGWSP